MVACIVTFLFARVAAAGAPQNYERPAPRPHLIAPDQSILAKEQAAWKFFDQARDGNHTTDESIALLAKCEAALGRTEHEVEEYRAFFYAMAKRYDEAFDQGERLRRLGDITGIRLTEDGASRTTIARALELDRGTSSVFIADSGHVAMITVVDGPPILCSRLSTSASAARGRR